FEAMYLCFIISFPSVFSVHQRFGECCESCLWLPYGSICFGEKRQKMRSPHLCPCRTQGDQALIDLLDSFLHLSLVCQCPATHERTDRSPERKSLCRSKSNDGVRTFLGCLPLLAVLMEKRRIN